METNSTSARTCKVTGLVVRSEKRFTVQADLVGTNSATFKETAYFAGAVKEYADKNNLEFTREGTSQFDLIGDTLPQNEDGILAAIDMMTTRATKLILSEEPEAVQFVTTGVKIR